jgi:hypothetical protein
MSDDDKVVQFPQQWEPLLYKHFKVKRAPLWPLEQSEVWRWALERGVSYDEMLIELHCLGVI